MTADAAPPLAQPPVVRALGLILGASLQRPLVVLHRSGRNDDTFAGDVVECRLGRGPALHLFCKHGPTGRNSAHGHRGGLSYESEVYQYLSRHSRLPLVRFRGSYHDKRANYYWLVLDHLNGCQGLHRVDHSEAVMAQAAMWAGHFHAEQEACRPRWAKTLKKYDREYYAGWVHRTRRFARPLRERFPWLERLYKCFERLTDELLQWPPTLIHGEFYPKNILRHRGTIHPVDWESAAIGPGEIDLATLTEGWTRQITCRCEIEYCGARWPGGAPADFARRLAVCRLYIHFRWLGDRAEWTVRKSSDWHFNQLHKLGRQLGVFE